MEQIHNSLHIKNMVCQRCIMTVEGIFDKLQIPFHHISLGEAHVQSKLSPKEMESLQQELRKVGFELIDSRVNKLIESIKQVVMEYLNLGMDSQNLKLSS